MRGTISTGLQLLANGLAPFVERSLRERLGDDWSRNGSVAHIINSADPDQWDAQVVLVLMWEHWNQVFRHDLSFVERSLVSELREFRNRWAHQQAFSERDTYRCLDGIERLLRAVRSEVVEQADELRRESLHRLHDDELIETAISVRDWFSAGVGVSCGGVLVWGVLEYFQNPVSWILAVLICIVFGRYVYRTTRPKVIVKSGPRQCSECARVFYGSSCPYCEPGSVSTSGPRAATREVQSA